MLLYVRHTTSSCITLLVFEGHMPSAWYPDVCCVTGCTAEQQQVKLGGVMCVLCRHALSHPLVDPDAGQRPQQHHMRSTAAAAAKQQHGRLMSLPQPILSSLNTRVQPVHNVEKLLKDMRSRLAAMQATLLPQLQAQANKMSPGANVGKP